MIMTLNVQESGRVKYVKRPGAVLEAGCVVARLELDDPSKVHPVCSQHLAQLPRLAHMCSWHVPGQQPVLGTSGGCARVSVLWP